MISRRQILKVAGAATLAAPMINLGRFTLFAQSSATYSRRTLDLVRRSTVIDMLGPFTVSQSKQREWLSNPEKFTAADLQRFVDSGINVFNVSVPSGGREYTVGSLAGWNSFLANFDREMMRVDSVADLDRVKASGKIGALLGLQNSDHFRNPDDVDFFWGLGQRVSQLTYNARNLIGNGSTERRDEGLSDFGLAIVERMNKVGMVVDVSHCGDQTTLDAFEVSTKPVLITHSNCRALVPGHPRLKTDEAIRKMAAKGGVMGLTGVRMFVKAEEPTTIENLLDHFDHVANLVGVEHLGVGSDVDLEGYDDMPPEENKRLRAAYKGSYAFRHKIDIEGLDHPKRIFDLTEGLVRRKYSDKDIELILGGNFKRALTEIWSVGP